ncbi:MAG: helix-turn-helix domain-containing protein [Candidatus Omnitrophica bacterium]|nr:helix-turn-helix domain-containing protein [Candidatus Omnitrophota bacterium]
MANARRFRDYLKEQLKDPAFRKAYEEEGLFVELAVQIAHLRQRKGVTQRQLAKRLHTSQQTISRLESPRNGSLSLRTLIRIAHALGKELKVQFV